MRASHNTMLEDLDSLSANREIRKRLASAFNTCTRAAACFTAYSCSQEFFLRPFDGNCIHKETENVIISYMNCCQ